MRSRVRRWRGARRIRLWSLVFNHGVGTVAGHKNLVGYAANVSLGDGVDPVELIEKLAPVPVTQLIKRQLLRYSLVVIEAAQQVGSCARFEHLQFGVSYVGGLQFLN